MSSFLSSKKLTLLSSLFFSCYFMTSLASSILCTIGMLCIAVSFELVKNKAFTTASTRFFWVSEKEKTVIVCSCVFFVIVSIMASVFSISSFVEKQNQDAACIGGHLKNLSTEKELILNDLGNLQDQQKIDLKNNFITRSDQRSTKINSMRSNLNEINSKIIQLQQQNNKSTTQKIKTRFISGEDDSLIENIIVLISALVLEVCYMFLFFFDSIEHKISPDPFEFDKDHRAQIQTQEKLEVHAMVQTVAQMILDGQLKPTQRDIKQFLRIGNEKTASIFLTLQQMGVVRREGKGFVVNTDKPKYAN